MPNDVFDDDELGGLARSYLTQLSDTPVAPGLGAAAVQRATTQRLRGSIARILGTGAVVALVAGTAVVAFAFHRTSVPAPAQASASASALPSPSPSAVVAPAVTELSLSGAVTGSLTSITVGCLPPDPASFSPVTTGSVGSVWARGRVGNWVYFVSVVGDARTHPTSGEIDVESPDPSGVPGGMFRLAPPLHGVSGFDWNHGVALDTDFQTPFTPSPPTLHVTGHIVCPGPSPTPPPTGSATHLTLSGAVSGALQTSTVSCQPGWIIASGTVNGNHEGVTLYGDQTGALAEVWEGTYAGDQPFLAYTKGAGVSGLDWAKGAILNINLPAFGSGAIGSVHVTGTIVCPATTSPVPSPIPSAGFTPPPVPLPVSTGHGHLTVSGKATGTATVTGIAVVCKKGPFPQSGGYLNASQITATGQVNGQPATFVINQGLGASTVSFAVTIGGIGNGLPGWVGGAGTPASVGLTNFDIAGGATINATLAVDTSDLAASAGPLTVTGALSCS